MVQKSNDIQDTLDNKKTEFLQQAVLFLFEMNKKEELGLEQIVIVSRTKEANALAGTGTELENLQLASDIVSSYFQAIVEDTTGKDGEWTT